MNSMSEIIAPISILAGCLVGIGAAMLADLRRNIAWYVLPCLYSVLFNFILGTFNGRGFDIFFTVFLAIFCAFVGWGSMKAHKHMR